MIQMNYKETLFCYCGNFVIFCLFKPLCCDVLFVRLDNMNHNGLLIFRGKSPKLLGLYRN